MDPATPRAAPPLHLVTLAKTFSRLLRFRRAASAGAAAHPDADSDDSISRLKLSAHLATYSVDAFYEPEKPKPPPPPQPSQPAKVPEANTESLLASLFAGVSAVKAAYAQLQLAQSPYDADSIQSADGAVVAELKRLSELKHSFLKNQLDPAPAPALVAHLEEQRNLVRTYQITARRLEADLLAKDAEAQSLRDQLLDAEKQHRALEAQLRPGRSLAALDDLHLSGLNPTHFLSSLRCAVKSVRSFVKSMMAKMESCGWDLDAAAAAAAVNPGSRLRKPAHRKFAFEAFVCQKMFSNFHCRDFTLSFLEESLYWDRRRFFQEFSELKSVSSKRILGAQSTRWAGFGKFCRAKYLSLVHPKMETTFFGGLTQRGVVSTGPGFPDSPWFTGFAEMARRVWLLHCLFFSFHWGRDAGEVAGSIFQARQGARFSEMYMESVEDDGGGDQRGGEWPTVGFTVVPGFRVGRTVIQCEVYLSSRDGRS